MSPRVLAGSIGFVVLSLAMIATAVPAQGENPSGAEAPTETTTPLAYATYLGGVQADWATSVTVDGKGRSVVVGRTLGPGFPVTPGALDMLYRGGGDVFIARFSPDASVPDFVTYLGGSEADSVAAVATDPSGAIYITGWTVSPDFPVTSGAYNTTFFPDWVPTPAAAYVLKLAESGDAIAYSTFLGPGEPHDLVVDPVGAVFVVGDTRYNWFPTTPGAFDRVLEESSAFLTKIVPDGSDLEFSTFLGGNGSASANRVVATSSGAVYLAGDTMGGFPVTPGAFDTTHNSVWANGAASDGFVAEVDATGSTVLHATYFGGSLADSVEGLVLDLDGGAILSLTSYSDDLPATAGAYAPRLRGATDGFIVKLSPDLTSLDFSTYLGGSGMEAVSGIARDDAGCLLVTGWTGSSDFPISTNAFEPIGAGDGFLAKLCSAGRELAYGTYLGGADPWSVTAEAGGEAVIAGAGSADFPVTADAYDRECDYVDAIFVRFLIPNIAPRAAIDVTPGTEGTTATTFMFDGSRSVDLDGRIVYWFWNFGDGAVRSGERAPHRYLKSGSYLVSLLVTDEDGAQGRATILIHVLFTISPTLPPTIGSTQPSPRATVKPGVVSSAGGSARLDVGCADPRP